MTVDKNLTIDLNRVQPQKVIRIHEGDIDSVRVVLKLTKDNTALTLGDITVKYNAVIAGHLAEEDAEAVVSDDTIIVPVTENMTKLNGLLQIDVKIIEDTSVLFTQTISLLVDRAVINEDTVIDISGTTIGERLSSIEATLETKADSASVYTKTQTDTLLAGKADKWHAPYGNTEANSVNLDELTEEGNYTFWYGYGYVEGVPDNFPTEKGWWVLTNAKILSNAIAQVIFPVSALTDNLSNTVIRYARTHDPSGWREWEDVTASHWDVTDYGRTEKTSINLDEFTEEGNHTFVYNPSSCYVYGELPNTFPTEATGYWILINAKWYLGTAQILIPIYSANITSSTGETIIRYIRHITDEGSVGDWIEVTSENTTVNADTEVTENSTNPVTSGAVYTALQNKSDKWHAPYGNIEANSINLDELTEEGNYTFWYGYGYVEGVPDNFPTDSGWWILTNAKLLSNAIAQVIFPLSALTDTSGGTVVRYARTHDPSGWREWEELSINLEDEVTEGSTNAVTGGAVYTALQSKANYKKVTVTNDTTVLGNLSDSSTLYLVDMSNVTTAYGLPGGSIGYLLAPTYDTQIFITQDGTMYTRTEAKTGGMFTRVSAAIDCDTEITEGSTNPVTSGAVYTALQKKASVESGTFTSTAWYAGDSTKTIDGTYEIIGDYIFITATAYRISGWQTVYYTLPATPLGACAATAFYGDTAYNIQTNSLTSSSVTYPVVQIERSDKELMTDGIVMFSMIYKVS